MYFGWRVNTLFNYLNVDMNVFQVVSRSEVRHFPIFFHYNYFYLYIFSICMYKFISNGNVIYNVTRLRFVTRYFNVSS